MKSNGTKAAKYERSTAADRTRKSLARIAMAAIVFIVLALAISNSANAGVFNVSNVTELIDAITMANDEVAHQGSDTIIMAPGTYTTVAPGIPATGPGVPAITSEIVINGNGAIIERGAPVFQVGSSGSLSLNDLTVRAGGVRGIRNEGTLTMSNSTVSGNFLPGGVGFRPIRGAGIWNAGTLTMINSTVSGNIFPQAGIDHHGGGIGNEGTLTIINSTITGNGGMSQIWNGSDPSAPGPGSRTVIVNSSTVGNIVNENSMGTVIIGNSIVGSCGLGGGTFLSLGYNLDSNGSCHLTEIGDRPNSNAGLGPLQNNGGPTQTQALLPGSDAIDAGDPEGCKDADGNLLTTDQRGFIRAVNGGSGSARCDIGAYEFNSTPVGLENIDGFVTFEPLISTYKTTAVTTDCPLGFVRKFSFAATLRNISDRALSKLMTEVKTLTNGNLLQNADGGHGGVGAIVTVQETGEFSDGALAPGEFVDVPFTICLKQLAPFSFFVDVLGSPQ